MVSPNRLKDYRARQSQEAAVGASHTCCFHRWGPQTVLEVHRKSQEGAVPKSRAFIQVDRLVEFTTKAMLAAEMEDWVHPLGAMNHMLGSRQDPSWPKIGDLGDLASMASRNLAPYLHTSGTGEEVDVHHTWATGAKEDLQSRQVGLVHPIGSTASSLGSGFRSNRRREEEGAFPHPCLDLQLHSFQLHFHNSYCFRVLQGHCLNQSRAIATITMAMS